MQHHGRTRTPRETPRNKSRRLVGNPSGGRWRPLFRRLAPAVGSLAAGVLLVAALTLLPASPAWSEPNFFEKRNIELQALEAFKQIINRWREEVYFELYDSGMEESQKRITRQDFAQRMVELSWVPQGELNPKFLKLRYHFRTMVYVTARVPYRHKFDQTRSFSKDQTMVMVWEKGQWRIDLIELIRSPYSGV